VNLRSLVALLVLCASGCTIAAAANGQDRTEPGCVEKLLQAPRPTKAVLEHAGRRTGATRQVIAVALRYEAVEGCDTLARMSLVRFQMELPGGGWIYPEGKGWISLTHGRDAANDGAIEVSYDDHAATLLARCEAGRRPRYRVQVRAQVGIVASDRFAGTGPAKDFPIAYAPSGSARC